MTIKLSGVQLGNITGGPSAINLYDLADVSIVSPQTGQYLRYNGSISEWQNSTINTEVYGFLDTNLSGSNGVVLTKVSGPQTVDIGLNITASGDATGNLTSGNIGLTLATVNSNVGTFGSATTVPVVTVNAKGLITAVSQVAFTGTAPLATSLAGGATGDLPYQSAAGVTSFLSAGTTSQVLVGSPTAPSWTNTPTLTGTNFTGIPNAALTNNSLTIGSTNIALGGTSTTLAGLTSVTSTGFTGALTGNADTATTLQTTRTFSATGDATATAQNFNGSQNVALPMVLATVNGSPQTDTFRKITVNGKGLTTATSAVVAGDITTALGYTPVNKAGDTMTGALILNADPSVSLEAATKQYVDNVASGMNVHLSCSAGTTANLTATYNNGASGVGATLTANPSVVMPSIDGVTMAVNDRILIKDQSTQSQNGIYVVTQITAPWILTRASDFDNSPVGEIVAGDSTFIQEGTIQGSTQWVQTTAGTITIGTSNIVFTQFGGPGTYTAGTGIGIAGTVISNTGVLSNVAGTGISVSGATGNVTVTNTGVTSLAGTAGNITASAATGAVTMNLATVTDSGSGTFLKLTRDTFGRVSGTTAVVAGDITPLVNATYVLKSGDTMTGALTATSFIPSSSTVPTNGVYLPAANTVGIATSSTERVRFDSAGSIFMGTTSSGGTSFANQKPLTGNATATGYRLGTTIQSDVTTIAYGFRSQVATVAEAFTLPSLMHFAADQSTIGAGSSVTNQYGYSAGSTLTGATNNYGFYGNIGAATGRWNLYMNGAARNYLNGNTTLGLQDPVTLASSVPRLQSNTTSVTALDAVSWATGTTHNVGFGKSKSGTQGTFGAVTTGDQISLDMRYDTGAAFEAGARIIGLVTGAVSAGNIPTALTFHTRNTADGNTTERLSITETGAISFGATRTAYGTSGQILTSAGNAPPTWSSTFSGTSTTATNATNIAITADNATNANMLLTWVDTASGNNALKVSSGPGLFWNPGTGVMTVSTTFGSLTLKGSSTSTPAQISGGAGVTLLQSATTIGTFNNQGYSSSIDGTLTTPSLRWASDSTIGIYKFGTGVVGVKGALTASGDLTAFSDARLKEDVVTIPDALSKVCKLRGVNFTRIDTKQKSTGLIAQEVNEIIPEVVHSGADDKMMSVAYGNLVGILIESIKELNSKIESLQAQLDNRGV